MLKEDGACQITNIHVHETFTLEKIHSISFKKSAKLMKTIYEDNIFYLGLSKPKCTVTRLCCLCFIWNSCWLCVAAGDPRPERLRLQLVVPDAPLLPQQRWLQEEQHVQVKSPNTQCWPMELKAWWNSLIEASAVSGAGIVTQPGQLLRSNEPASINNVG